ncbi:hypothetical protein Kpol_1031p32 [Vanderwaltozyma polyspora DSM 70294]|uniref:mitogen-activated protein kinase kinase n=1 Tax=Vanderwaltozyma polyspora (strain ATCC 22028 / DSM 70294 / BCRC 21397 / CBS 2163 / NBRC 10782 / NRRL Y-8283 / UCD 57-17) TaxID=436907 RepID=A7THW6_VANPO|nr:uncharacterized protein Kpol_1031p32 [Vanderwaltozyma polyspora DSM 70294]EDO18128.1 hypothetical protein Kpol_1031p32 [Vanderwaltozyma polyspora DSM 70294]
MSEKIETEPTRRCDLPDEKESSISVPSSGALGSSIKRASSTSSSSSSSAQYSNINANLHARVKAFQEQRVLRRSNSDKNNSEKNKSTSNPNSVNFDSKTEKPPIQLEDHIRNLNSASSIQQIVNKPLPPLPPLPKSEANELPAVPTKDIETDMQNNILAVPTDTPESIVPSQVNKNTLNPNRTAPKRPPTMRPMGNLSNISNRNIPQRPVQSLSQRRGLKLPPGGMSLKLSNKPQAPSNNSTGTVQQHEFAASPSNANQPKPLSGKKSNPGSLVNAVQSTSTSSSAEDRADTEGTNPRSFNSNGSDSSGSGGLFANFSKYVDIKSGSLNFAGKLSLSSKGINFSNGVSSNISLDELEFLGELGRGNYGTVSKVLHKPTNVVMAMKEVRLELDESKFRQILMELEVLHKCNSPCIVDFYGAFFIEGAVYMCMEYMDGGSLDKIYDSSKEIGGIDEPQLAYITESVIRGLMELKDGHNIIHRDVKPTNVLCSASQGTVKLCDFGVSGNLVASLAKTNIGCQSYMAPERIRSTNPDMTTYTVQSDIWSLGLSILEMALGSYPYPPETYDNIFSQLSAIVDGPPPILPQEKFSKEAQDFVSLCLQKVPERRPTYSSLLNHPWLLKYRNKDVQMGKYITERIAKRDALLKKIGEPELPRYLPALHMGGL